MFRLIIKLISLSQTIKESGNKLAKVVRHFREGDYVSS